MDQFSAHLDRGWELIARNDPRGAESSARRALEIDPQSPEAHNLLGYSAALAGNAEEAINLSIEKFAPTWKGQEAMLVRSFKETFIPSVWQSSVTKAKGLGTADMATWQKSIDLLVEYKVIPKRFRAEDLVVQPGAIA